MLTGLISMMIISIVSFIRKKDLVPLPTSIAECPVNLIGNVTTHDNFTDSFNPTSISHMDTRFKTSIPAFILITGNPNSYT
jgi:hypothetical protein